VSRKLTNDKRQMVMWQARGAGVEGLDDQAYAELAIEVDESWRMLTTCIQKRKANGWRLAAGF
jgi:hypothetical protein